MRRLGHYGHIVKMSISITYSSLIPAAMVELVRAFTLNTEGQVFEVRSRKMYRSVKLTAERSATGMKVTGPRR